MSKDHSEISDIKTTPNIFASSDHPGIVVYKNTPPNSVAAGDSAIARTITTPSPVATERSSTVEYKFMHLNFVAADHPENVESVTIPPTSLNNENSFDFFDGKQSKTEDEAKYETLVINSDSLNSAGMQSKTEDETKDEITGETSVISEDSLNAAGMHSKAEDETKDETTDETSVIYEDPFNSAGMQSNTEDETTDETSVINEDVFNFPAMQRKTGDEAKDEATDETPVIHLKIIY